MSQLFAKKINSTDEKLCHIDSIPDMLQIPTFSESKTKHPLKFEILTR